ncbi:MAG TPA: FHA domain-containing protein, partial [Polyangiaceae bacterium]|nr:FHA domain-containing protein [Polyangiaceae bacterium]
LALWEPARAQARVAAQNMSGAHVEHQPGAHYFATRLFDLDFARVGRIEKSEGSHEIIDFPRGTGQIAYRKLVFSGGRLAGALMIGERSLKVRAIGRNMKRLVDAAVDVTEVSHRLLEPSFDVEAWLERKRLVERPALPPKTTLVPQAKLKRTQVVSLGSALQSGTLAIPSSRTGGTVALPSGALSARAPAPHTALVASSAAVSHGSLAIAQSGMTAAIPSGPRRTKLLSIGLHAEAAPEASLSLAPLDARLEGLGRTFAITLPVTNLGQSPECQIPLQDPGLSAFHAQLLRYDTGLYLRDLGSSTGTWVNGQCLFGPRALWDGDRIALGKLEFVFRSNALQRRAAEVVQHSVGGPRLEVRSGGSLGLGFALGANAVRLGGAPDCAIRLTDPSVSSHHAEFRAAGAGHVVTDLGSFGGSFLRGARLAPGQVAPLSEGDWLRFGAVDMVYTSLARPDAMAGLRPSARVSVTSGSDSGKTASIGERLVIGSDPRAGFVLPSVAPQQLELAAHGGKFWVRDLSAGRAFRAGSPIGPEFSEIQHGDLLLLSGTVMLRFEEAP